MIMGLQYLLRAVLDLLVTTPVRLLLTQGSSQCALVPVSGGQLPRVGLKVNMRSQSSTPLNEIMKTI